MRQTTVQTSLSHRLHQSAIILCILPLLVLCQGSATDSCTRDCSGRPTNQICASNGVTYNNRCEMQLAACQEGLDLTVRAEGPCNSPAEPDIHQKGETCSQHSSRIKEYASSGELPAECSESILQEKSDNGTITMRDLINCYHPDCDSNGNEYERKQCHTIGNRRKNVEWCWCSGPTGLSIPDTLTTDMQPNECALRQSCHYLGSEYSDGEVFQPEHKCGICECLDGNVTCFEDFVPNVEGELNATQLNQLSHLLKQFFYFENNHKDSILSNIRDIARIISDISNETQMHVLNEWFEYYDSDGNGCIELNHTEEVSFHDHLHQFTSCKHFLDHVSEVFDTDSNGSITLTEWLEFFIRHTPELDTENAEIPSIDRRSVSPFASTAQRKRRSLHSRQKFFYVLTS